MSFASLFFALVTTLPAASGETSARPVMLDFTATWCGPCRQAKPVVEQLAREGLPIKAVDIDRSPELAEKYKITGVPTFVVIDPKTGKDLGRISGAQPAETLLALYNKGRARMPRRPAPEPAEETEDRAANTDTDHAADEGREVLRGQSPDNPEDAGRESASEERWVNPKPWETVVRIKVHGNGSIGFGSGTIISSNSKESIILTCAHIFKLERGPQAPPSRFPRKITIDLFDGVLSGPKGNQVHYTQETLAGEAVDYDFSRDVGLIRIRPGRRLPYARVVPPHWTPKAGMVGLYTVGCSEGHDATTWKTRIINPAFKGLAGHDVYEAIECMTAPKQGRSGGGLFTEDGYVAGVCDFAEPRGDHGLYASPKSIYYMLDRNNLVALYDPTRGKSDTLVAENRSPRRSTRNDAGRQPKLVARGQSPRADDPGGVTLPPPGMLGIKPPRLASSDGTVPARRGSWRATPAADAGNTVDLKMDPALDPDHFNTAEPTGESREEAVPVADEEPAPRAAAARPAPGKWKAGRSPLPALSEAGVE